MSVYVDEIRCYGLAGPRCFREGSCHMWADTLEELHALARKIGLRRGWFQTHHRLPHYDLTPRRRVLALKAGAQAASLKEYLRVLRVPALPEPSAGGER